MEHRRADAAILDFSLRDGPSVDVLRELKSCGVPILLYSAFNEVPDDFRELPHILKPGAFDQIVNALDKLLLGEDTASSAPTSKGSTRTVNRLP